MPERKSINYNPRKAHTPFGHQIEWNNRSRDASPEAYKAANANRYCACGKPATRVIFGRACWCSACWAKETM